MGPAPKPNAEVPRRSGRGHTATTTIITQRRSALSLRGIHVGCNDVIDQAVAAVARRVLQDRRLARVPQVQRDKPPLSGQAAKIAQSVTVSQDSTNWPDNTGLGQTVRTSGGA
jgi:hypothetical protein